MSVSTDNAKAATFKQIVFKIDNDVSISREEYDTYLEQLKFYECWVPFLNLIKRSIKNPKTRQLSDYVKLAKVQHSYLEDIYSAAETCAHAVADLALDYSSFIEAMYSEILGLEEYDSEAIILENIYSMLTRDEDLIACLERLCLIYEKKRFNENLLNQTYEKLIAIDPQNLKALRYFKVLFTQSNDWAEVIRILQTLHLSAKHRNDKFRIAQEIAAVYLYQMDLPRKAVEMIENYCASSPLDTSSIHFDAYYRLRDWDGCLNVLREYLLKVESDSDRAIGCFKAGELEEKCGRLESARDFYLKCIKFVPSMLEPYENLIKIALQNKDWSACISYLKRLKTQIHMPLLADRIEEACERIKSGYEKSQGAIAK
ncbi:MAG: hypothetical protein HQK54_00370 [Oligoflexales bacterium]|nr:hypothetical protein [Oligoflexales bacterium]